MQTSGEMLGYTHKPFGYIMIKINTDIPFLTHETFLKILFSYEFFSFIFKKNE